ncbi:hypothetical protein PHJA_001865300 [Phtheirospermum japonicum]|uniref:Uncharacterized protein n=1 Tax=Phtheirospermum japonicum TaxID=374723 RepID=A0A830CFX6_9LAMI|nr:hypothetical protein PHJA_001865300 [Phtheirospermum japonicum]
MAEKNNKDLLKMEVNTKTVASTSCLESKLFVCKKDNSFTLFEAPLQNPSMSPVPKSHVHDFLGIISKSNKKLLQDAKNNPENYDIEMLNGKESEYIEMDMMLGVADLHTPEAVAAAESAMAGRPPLIIWKEVKTAAMRMMATRTKKKRLVNQIMKLAHLRRVGPRMKKEILHLRHQGNTNRKGIPRLSSYLKLSCLEKDLARSYII